MLPTLEPNQFKSYQLVTCLRYYQVQEDNLISRIMSKKKLNFTDQTEVPILALSYHYAKMVIVLEH